MATQIHTLLNDETLDPKLKNILGKNFSIAHHFMLREELKISDWKKKR